MAITLDGTTGITTPDLTDTSLTSGRVVYAGTSGNLTGSTALTFDGAILGVNGISVGRGAGAVATTTALGASALAANSSGGNNVAIGYQAGLANSTGGQSTLIGSQAGLAGTDLDYVTAVGYQALSSVTSGDFNTAVGAQALKSNTSASYNTAVGYLAAYLNTTGAYQAAFGYKALTTNNTGQYNTAIGAAAMEYNTTGNENAALGLGALNANTTGSNNTALGRAALQSNTTASNNTAVGYLAGYTNQTGGENVFVGNLAGYTSNVNNANVGNTCLGARSGYALTTGVGNTFVGGNNPTGAGSGQQITTGSYNTIIGGYSGNAGGLDIRTSSNYIVLADGAGNPRGIFNAAGGFLVGTTTTIGSGTAQVSVEGSGGVVGAFKSVGGSGNECVFNWNNSTSGNNLFTSFYTETTATGRGSIDYNRGAGLTRYNTTSDATLKNIIGDSDGAKSVEILNSTRIREYSWKEDQANKPQIGVIAQELYETFSGAVSVGGDKVSVDEEGNETTQYVPWAVDKTAFTFHLVKGWQAHERIIQELKAEFDAYKLTHP